MLDSVSAGRDVEGAVDGLGVDMTLVLLHLLAEAIPSELCIDAHICAQRHDDLGSREREVVNAVEDLLRQGEEGTGSPFGSVRGSRTCL